MITLISFMSIAILSVSIVVVPFVCAFVFCSVITVMCFEGKSINAKNRKQQYGKCSFHVQKIKQKYRTGNYKMMRLVIKTDD